MSLVWTHIDSVLVEKVEVRLSQDVAKAKRDRQVTLDNPWAEQGTQSQDILGFPRSGELYCVGCIGNETAFP